MSDVPSELRDEIPSFDKHATTDHGPIDWSGLTSMRTAKSALEIGAIIALFAVVFFGLELILRWTNTPTYVFPKPIDVVQTLCERVRLGLRAPPLGDDVRVPHRASRSARSIGLVLAALITQKPFVEKVIAPYILIMVTTPMIALVPFLRLKLGFGSWPLIIAVALASGPMVMINSATGFRRTDLAKIALARSYGASTFQIFRKIRFPLALPMIIVGFMVGSIFGLLTAVGGEMVAASEEGGLGERLVYYSSLARMDEFGAMILIIAALGVAIYVLFYFVGKRWASWEA